MKSALFVCGGWEGHEPQKCAQIFADSLESQNFSVMLSDTLEVLDDAAGLKLLDLVVPAWTMGELTKQQETNLADAVAKGTGLAGWHGMADAFRNNLTYKLIVGGQFVWHPPIATDISVEITDPDDPITRGIGPFTIRSEHYYMHTDPSNHVLATSTCCSAGYNWHDRIKMPVAWKRKWGIGKVFYSSIGHSALDFDSLQLKQLTERGLIWAAR